MMRRYIGRATGQRRKLKKRFPVFWPVTIATAIMGVVLVAVLIMNPGADRAPDKEEGPQQSSGVTPETTSSPTPSERHGTNS
jgi:hypothetical protein